NPEFELLDSETVEEKSSDMGRIVPIYEAIKGCSSRMIRRIMYGLVNQLEQIDDFLPATVLSRYQLPDRKTALVEAHFPPPDAALELLQRFRHSSQKRLIFEEFFYLELGLALKKRKSKTLPGYIFHTGSPV